MLSFDDAKVRDILIADKLFDGKIAFQPLFLDLRQLRCVRTRHVVQHKRVIFSVRLIMESVMFLSAIRQKMITFANGNDMPQESLLPFEDSSTGGITMR